MGLPGRSRWRVSHTSLPDLNSTTATTVPPSYLFFLAFFLTLAFFLALAFFLGIVFVLAFALVSVFFFFFFFVLVFDFVLAFGAFARAASSRNGLGSRAARANQVVTLPAGGKNSCRRLFLKPGPVKWGAIQASVVSSASGLTCGA